MTMECKSIKRRVGTCLFVVFLICLVGVNHPGSAQTKSANAAPAQIGFETPQLASAAIDRGSGKVRR